MAKHYPIIYVRGYAMTASERDETAADPFCGFNVGSTTYRAAVDKTAKVPKFVFESPLVRLVTDFGYRHVYQEGADILDPEWTPGNDEAGNPLKGIPPRSIIVYRYYDSGSTLFGDGHSRSVPEYARGLSQLLDRVRDLVGQWQGGADADDMAGGFRCNLVAHSMGGLVCRAMLQNPDLDVKNMRASVDKFFTYATPHNGIEVAGFNVPNWLSGDEANTFNRTNMATYLAMAPIADANAGRVDFMPEDVMPSTKVFCMVGTNRGDYEVGMGLSRTFVGHGSDGLVRIANASLWGYDREGGAPTLPVATAFAFRSHSGQYGIVNSEEAYQNLARFLFGDVRVDIWLDVDKVRLPAALEPHAASVEALYQVDLKAAPRGKRWFLSRRTAEEDSAACRTHAQLTAGTAPFDKAIHLSTIFLSNKYRIGNDLTLQYGMDVKVGVPDYQLDHKFWPNEHIEGSALYNDSLTVTLTQPPVAGGAWQVDAVWSLAREAFHWDIAFKDLVAGNVSLRIPLVNADQPGIEGSVRLEVRPWNV